jgi:hypothetical protein
VFVRKAIFETSSIYFDIQSALIAFDLHQAILFHIINVLRKAQEEMFFFGKKSRTSRLFLICQDAGRLPMNKRKLKISFCFVFAILLIIILANQAFSVEIVPLAKYLDYARAAADWTWNNYDDLIERWKQRFDPESVFGYRPPEIFAPSIRNHPSNSDRIIRTESRPFRISSQ